MDPLDDVASVSGIVGQAQLELRIGEPELALVDLAEIGPVSRYSTETPSFGASCLRALTEGRRASASIREM